MDRLLDIMVLLPSLLEQLDALHPQQATSARRSEIQLLLRNCLDLEVKLNDWFQAASSGTAEHPLSYWAEDVTALGADLPFSQPYSFKDSSTGMMFVYFWMTQIALQGCIDGLDNSLYQPVSDSYPDMWPETPPLTLDIAARYHFTRDMADNVCRGLDSALAGTMQPDLLVAPLTIAQDYYRNINAASGDGLLELLWLDSFRVRLIEKGQFLASTFQQHRWHEVTSR